MSQFRMVKDRQQADNWVRQNPINTLVTVVLVLAKLILIDAI